MNNNKITEFRDLEDTFTIDEVEEVLESKEEELKYESENQNDPLIIAGLETDIQNLEEFIQDARDTNLFIKESYIDKFIVDNFMDHNSIHDDNLCYIDKEKVVRDNKGDYEEIEFQGDTFYHSL